MRTYFIPLCAYSTNPWISESHPNRVIELHEKARKTNSQLYVVGAPDGLTPIVAPRFSATYREPILTSSVIHPLSVVMAQQLEEILKPARKGENDEEMNQLYIYLNNYPHDILRKTLARAYESIGRKMSVRAIYDNRTIIENLSR